MNCQTSHIHIRIYTRTLGALSNIEHNHKIKFNRCRCKMSLLIFGARINKKHLIKLNANILSICGRYRSTEAAAIQNDEIKSSASEDVSYPKILDLSPRACKEREQIAWHEEVKKLNTIEEKLIKVNIPKYYGWQMMHLTDKHFAYNTLPYVQHYTRTQFEDGLPKEWTKHSPEQLDAIVEGIKEHIEDVILFHHQEYR